MNCYKFILTIESFTWKLNQHGLKKKVHVKAFECQPLKGLLIWVKPLLSFINKL
jgi:hypothetical protein